MGLMTEVSLHDEVLGMDKEQALRVHLSINFFPPHPKYVVDETVEAFKKHWAGELDDLNELAEKCYLRDTGGLYKYYSTFLNEE